MGKILIIGCGGVASVAIQKCCQVSEVFTEMCIASRTVSKCEACLLYTSLEHGAMYVPYVVEYKEYYRLFTCCLLYTSRCV